MTAVVNLSPIFNAWQGFGTSIVLLDGGKLYTYYAGTTDSLETYTTNIGDVQNENPIILNQDGRPPYEIWLVQGQSYNFVLTDANDNHIGIAFDNIWGLNDPTHTVVPLIPPEINGYAMLPTATAGGTANALTATFSPQPTGWTGWQVDATVLVTAAFANTTAATLNVGDIYGDVPIKKYGTLDLSANDIYGAGHVLILTGEELAGNPIWTLANPSAIASTPGAVLPDNYLTGLTLSPNVTTPTKDVDIAKGQCTDFTNTVTMTLAAAMSKRIDASWVAGGTPGSPLGGFPTGISLTSDTPYHFLLISKADGTVDCGFDSSDTATNLLADATGFIYYRHTGWVLYHTTTIRTWEQYGDLFRWDSMQLDLNGGSNASGANVTLTCPPSSTGLPIIAKTQQELSSAVNGTDLYGILTSLTQTNVNPSATEFDTRAYHDGVFAFDTAMAKDVPVDSSSRIRYRVSNTDANMIVFTMGWIDTRGK